MTTHLQLAGLCLFLAVVPAQAFDYARITQRHKLAAVNCRIAGRVLDFTYNHGSDCRLFSTALQRKRDLYVYLPPGYSPAKTWPVMLWLHGYLQDEHAFLDLVPILDDLICHGELPPFVVAAPDGSIEGCPSLLSAGSFYLNSKAGNFEDYIIQDVWGFVQRHFTIRPDRASHVLAGASMGGFGTYNLGFKYPHEFGVLMALLPPLNLRYCDCFGNTRANFDPNCTGYLEVYRPFAPVARFYGVITIRERNLVRPLYGRGPEVPQLLARENPIEMLAAYNIQPGQFAMFIGYNGRDEFNIDAQAESFIYAARCRGLCPTVSVNPDGRHNTRDALYHVPALSRWLMTVVPR